MKSSQTGEIHTYSFGHSEMMLVEKDALDQAEKKIQELQREVERLTLNCKGLVSDHHEDIGRIREMEKDMAALVEALEYCGRGVGRSGTPHGEARMAQKALKTHREKYGSEK